MSLESKVATSMVVADHESVKPHTVRERIARIRQVLPGVEEESSPMRADIRFTKESAPLFSKEFRQIYNQWRQDAKK